MRNTHTHAHTHIGVCWWKEDCVSIHHNTLEACWLNPCDDRALACDDHLGYTRRSIRSLLNTRVAQLQIFFAYYFFTFDWFRSSRLVSIEGDRRLEESSAQHANVYLRRRRIHVWVVWRTYIGCAYVYYGTYTYGV